MTILKKRKIRKFKRSFFFNKFFVKQNDKNVLFISTKGEKFEQLNRNISHFFYHKETIDIKHDSIKKQTKKILRAKYIFTDDIYLPLGCVKSDKKVIVNVGHINYTLKNDVPAVLVEDKFYQKCLEKTLDKINYHTVGSTAYKELLATRFNIIDSKTLDSGCPLMDKFHGYKYQEMTEETMQSYPDSLVNLNILYVPTIRDNEADNDRQLDFIEKLVNRADESISVYYHLHPDFKHKKKRDIVGAYEILSEELPYFYGIANVIVTDYSSIIFEACTTNKPIVFYQYDADSYKDAKLFDVVPGYKSTNADEMIQYLISGDYIDYHQSHYFDQFNEFNHGQSSRDLVLKILGKFKRTNG